MYTLNDTSHPGGHTSESSQGNCFRQWEGRKYFDTVRPRKRRGEGKRGKRREEEGRGRNGIGVEGRGWRG